MIRAGVAVGVAEGVKPGPRMRIANPISGSKESTIAVNSMPFFHKYRFIG
jgi:uncharacterized protein (DUF2344 family)